MRLEAVLALQISEACCYKQDSGFQLEVLIKRNSYVLAQRHGEMIRRNYLCLSLFICGSCIMQPRCLITR